MLESLKFEPEQRSRAFSSRVVTVETMFSMSLRSGLIIYHYDVLDPPG